MHFWVIIYSLRISISCGHSEELIYHGLDLLERFVLEHNIYLDPQHRQILCCFSEFYANPFYCWHEAHYLLFSVRRTLFMMLLPQWNPSKASRPYFSLRRWFHPCSDHSLTWPNRFPSSFGLRRSLCMPHNNKPILIAPLGTLDFNYGQWQ